MTTPIVPPKTQPRQARLAARFFGSGNVLIIHHFTLDMLGGDHLAALFLEQLLYWTERTNDRDGWIVKTYDEWEAELGLSKYLVRRICETLKVYGVETDVHRSPFHKMQPVVHYRVNLDALERQIDRALNESKVSLSRSEEISLSEGEETSRSITESTSETTGEAPLQNSHYNPPPIRVLQNDTLAQVKGYQLVAAYAEATGVIAETIWAAYQNKQVAAGLAKGGITPEDIGAFIQDMRRTQPERYNGYRFQYMAEDLPRWKRNAAAAPVSAAGSFWGRDLTDGE
jgi:hypothetical protein